jgi:hypothetical protein
MDAWDGVGECLVVREARFRPAEDQPSPGWCQKDTSRVDSIPIMTSKLGLTRDSSVWVDLGAISFNEGSPSNSCLEPRSNVLEG